MWMKCALRSLIKTSHPNTLSFASMTKPSAQLLLFSLAPVPRPKKPQPSGTRATLISESQRFHQALQHLTQMAGWEKQYSIRAESLGHALGCWYYSPEATFCERLGDGRVSSRGKAVDESLLYADIEAGLVSLARVPNDKWQSYIPFCYVY